MVGKPVVEQKEMKKIFPELRANFSARYRLLGQPANQSLSGWQKYNVISFLLRKKNTSFHLLHLSIDYIWNH